MQRDDGGSAFPSTPLGDDGKPGGAHRFGMSLRDWYAGQALSSIPLRSWDYLSAADDKVKAWATLAYAVADAMVAARSPAQEGGEADPCDELLPRIKECIEQLRDRLNEIDRWQNGERNSLPAFSQAVIFADKLLIDLREARSDG